MQLELVQPVEGDSIYHDFLIQHGEGLHHLNFLVDDADAISEILTGEGFPCLQSGRSGPREYKNTYCYHHIEPLHSIWEPIHTGGPKNAEVS